MCFDLNSHHTGSFAEKKECGDDLIILFKAKSMLLARGCDSEVYTWFKFLLAVLKQGRLIDSCSLIKLVNLLRFIALVLRVAGSCRKRLNMVQIMLFLKGCSSIPCKASFEPHFGDFFSVLLTSN